MVFFWTIFWGYFCPFLPTKKSGFLFDLLVSCVRNLGCEEVQSLFEIVRAKCVRAGFFGLVAPAQVRPHFWRYFHKKQREKSGTNEKNHVLQEVFRFLESKSHLLSSWCYSEDFRDFQDWITIILRSSQIKVLGSNTNNFLLFYCQNLRNKIILV